MSWHEEREKLLADTVAFVQHALGESLVLAVKTKMPLSPTIESAAQVYRRYHAERRPQHTENLRLELHTLSKALSQMQYALGAGQTDTATQHQA